MRAVRLGVVALMMVVVCGSTVLAAQDMERAKGRLERRVERQAKATGDSGLDADRTAAELFREYKANEIAADAKYKNKWLQVRGKVSAVAQGINGAPYLVLSEDAMGLDQVHAELFDVQVKTMSGKNFTVCNAREKAAAIKPGQKVAVECLGKGSVLGMPRLEECVIVPERRK